MGGGIVNIFIDYHPEQCFEEAMQIKNGMEPKPVEAGYRNFEVEDYVRLSPANDLSRLN